MEISEKFFIVYWFYILEWPVQNIPGLSYSADNKKPQQFSPVQKKGEKHISQPFLKYILLKEWP